MEDCRRRGRKTFLRVLIIALASLFRAGSAVDPRERLREYLLRKGAHSKLSCHCPFWQSLTGGGGGVIWGSVSSAPSWRVGRARSIRPSSVRVRTLYVTPRRDEAACYPGDESPLLLRGNEMDDDREREDCSFLRRRLKDFFSLGTLCKMPPFAEVIRFNESRPSGI